MFFGLTFEKIALLAVIAAVVIGPERLPEFAQALTRLVRRSRRAWDGTKERVRDEIGPDFDDVDWRRLDPRQYDPRRIVREALLEAPDVADDRESTTALARADIEGSKGSPVPLEETR